MGTYIWNLLTPRHLASRKIEQRGCLSVCAHLMWGLIVARLVGVQRGHIHVEFVDAQLRVVVHPLVDVWSLAEQRCHTCCHRTCTTQKCSVSGSLHLLIQVLMLVMPSCM